MYRIYLEDIENCHQWIDTPNIKEKVNDIENQIVHGIQTQCSQIPASLSIDGNHQAYGCPENHNIQNSIIYDAHLQGTSRPWENTTVLVSCLDRWIHESATIEVNGVELRINKECTGLLDKGIQDPTECSYDAKLTWTASLSIGFGIIIVLLLVIVIIIIIGITVYW